MNTYPITIKMSPRLLDAFADSELPSFEDHQADPDHSGIAKGDRHGYEVLTEFKSQFQLRNARELCDIWWRLCTGTFQLADSHLRSAKTLADTLRPYMEQDTDPQTAVLLRKYPRPDGL